MQLEQFAASTTAPVLGSLAAGPADFSAVNVRLTARGHLVRAVRGSKMPTVADVFREFAAALQFPWYFGENKDAFDECLRDIDEFAGPAPGYVVAVRDAGQVLSAEPEQREWFTSALTDAAQTWAGHERPVPFRVVLQTSGSGLLPGPFAAATPLRL